MRLQKKIQFSLFWQKARISHTGVSNDGKQYTTKTR